MENEFFTNSDLYKIDFEFIKLLEYLHLSQSTTSKKGTLKIIKDILDTKVSYQIKNSFYYQPFFYNFVYQKGINEPSTIFLSLNPYTTFGLLSDQHTLLINEKLREKYFKLVDLHTLNQKKKPFSFIHAVYVTFCHSFGFGKPELLNCVLLKKHQGKRELRLRQFLFFKDVFNLFSNYFGVEVGFKINGIDYFPLNFEKLQEIFMEINNKNLESLNFYFVQNKKLALLV